MYPFVEPTAPNPEVGNLGMVNTKYHSNQYRQRMTSEREKETLVIESERETHAHCSLRERDSFH